MINESHTNSTLETHTTNPQPLDSPPQTHIHKLASTDSPRQIYPQDHAYRFTPTNSPTQTHPQHYTHRPAPTDSHPQTHTLRLRPTSTDSYSKTQPATFLHLTSYNTAGTLLLWACLASPRTHHPTLHTLYLSFLMMQQVPEWC